MKKRHSSYSMGLMLIVFASLGLGACGPNEQQKAERAERKRVECLDKICQGDVEPPRDYTKDALLKLNGQWFVGPKEYFSSSRSSGFYWPSKTPMFRGGDYPEKGQDFYAIAIEILFRSNNISPAPRGYRLVELAEKNDWIDSRKTIRAGLDVITMKHVIGPDDQYIDQVTYYAATQLKGIDGLPPVATCNHDHPRNGGGTGFMWQDGVFAGIGMNQKHCADWPEIYQEITRVLSLLNKA
jgi:hypothetical protein